MELGDFSFFAFAPFLLISLTSVYLVLRKSGWEFRESLFMDSWFIWLASLVLAILSYVAVIGVTTKLELYLSIPQFWWLAISVSVLFVSNFLVTSIIVGLLRKRRREDIGVLMDTLPKQIKISSNSRISVLISLAETGTFALLLSISSVAGTIYDHYYPPQFGIYDI